MQLVCELIISFDSMKGWDPEGQLGPRKPLPDSVQILEPPLDKVVGEPTSDHRDQPAIVPQPVADEAAYQPQPEASFEQPEEFQAQPPAF